jgi:hypothetical protein
MAKEVGPDVVRTACPKCGKVYVMPVWSKPANCRQCATPLPSPKQEAPKQAKSARAQNA